jgi:hypothetical protein
MASKEVAITHNLVISSTTGTMYIFKNLSLLKVNAAAAAALPSESTSWGFISSSKKNTGAHIR